MPTDKYPKNATSTQDFRCNFQRILVWRECTLIPNIHIERIQPSLRLFPTITCLNVFVSFLVTSKRETVLEWAFLKTSSTKRLHTSFRASYIGVENQSLHCIDSHAYHMKFICYSCCNVILQRYIKMASEVDDAASTPAVAHSTSVSVQELSDHMFYIQQ